MRVQLSVGRAKRRLAEDVGPTFVSTPAPYPRLLADAGFTDIEEHDVSAEFGRIARRWLEESARLATELRRVLGDEEFEQRQADRRAALVAIEDGALGRAFYAATAP